MWEALSPPHLVDLVASLPVVDVADQVADVLVESVTAAGRNPGAASLGLGSGASAGAGSGNEPGWTETPPEDYYSYKGLKKMMEALEAVSPDSSQPVGEQVARAFGTAGLVLAATPVIATLAVAFNAESFFHQPIPGGGTEIPTDVGL